MRAEPRKHRGRAGRRDLLEQATHVLSVQAASLQHRRQHVGTQWRKPHPQAYRISPALRPRRRRRRDRHRRRSGPADRHQRHAGVAAVRGAGVPARGAGARGDLHRPPGLPDRLAQHRRPPLPADGLAQVRRDVLQARATASATRCTWSRSPSPGRRCSAPTATRRCAARPACSRSAPAAWTWRWPWAAARTSFRMPAVVRVWLTGALQPWVTAKDVILELLRRLTVRGGSGKIFEYDGPGLPSLLAAQRMTIANMGAELGLTTSVFAVRRGHALVPHAAGPRRGLAPGGGRRTTRRTTTRSSSISARDRTAGGAAGLARSRGAGRARSRARRSSR